MDQVRNVPLGSFYKLRTGEWGAIFKDGQSVSAGQTVIMSNRAGETQERKIRAILWTGEGKTLCKLRFLPRKKAEA